MMISCYKPLPQTLNLCRVCVQAFDHETGRPKRYVEMLSWPRAHRLHRALPTVLAGVFWESFVPTKAAATMRMVFNRCALVPDIAAIA